MVGICVGKGGDKPESGCLADNEENQMEREPHSRGAGHI